MTDLAQSSPPSKTVLLGDCRYGVDPGWGADPDGDRLGAISKITSSADGGIYVLQRRAPQLVRLDARGQVSASWSVPLVDPHGISTSPDGRIYAVDRDGHRVFKLGAGGEPLMVLGDAAIPRYGAPFSHPTDVAIADDGDIFVADGYGNSHVHRFSPEGALRRTWGGAGSEPGKFTTPHGICIIGEDRIAVGDRENNRIQVFDFDGGLVSIWTDVYHPMEICRDGNGLVYVSDQIPRITLFDPDGTMVGRCRTPLPYLAHGMAVSASGDIFLSGPGARIVARLSAIS